MNRRNMPDHKLHLADEQIGGLGDDGAQADVKTAQQSEANAVRISLTGTKATNARDHNLSTRPTRRAAVACTAATNVMFSKRRKAESGASLIVERLGRFENLHGDVPLRSATV